PKPRPRMPALAANAGKSLSCNTGGTVGSRANDERPGNPMSSRALRRVSPYVRPYRGQMALMLGAALGGIVAGTFIPLVAKGVIDGPIAHGQRLAILPLAGLVLALGLVDCS